MKAEIISVGTELLLGNTVNTNACYLSKRLAELGYFVYRQTTVGDNARRLMEVLNESLKRSELVIVTGGLGPTQDDLTKETVAKLFGLELELDEESLERIKKRTGEAIPSKPNEKQAYVPKGAIVLPNDLGTASGCIIEKAKKTVVLLPGPPREMKEMFEKYLEPYLKERSDEILLSKVLRIFGVRESDLASILRDFFEKYENPTVAPYALKGEVTIRITARAKNTLEAEKLIVPVENEIRKRLGEYIYAEGDTTMEEVVVELLKEAGLSIATAESCTGGLVAAKIINVPGASKVFKEGVIAYSNEAKERLLGVSHETLKTSGAVSSESVIEMAKGVAVNSQSDIGLSISGIAGPEGGTEEKPVGLVYIGLWFKGIAKAEKLLLHGDRNWIRLKATLHALNILRKALGDQPK
ncbi:damage-inducible protein CinA [Kosmotoga arenicorallina S304]|uniref:CinA-like protein n=1 Tax=Kosmotoga arenicorallina S304 TaxID=1453497 RepID=A0A176JYW1_9BACT|nr:competence/damage-inducible protein A [Kosmotoga arenicorallina]OAA29139.1 damage-inducible protein CinA [Kosmotoga arenicorallina S304]